MDKSMGALVGAVERGSPADKAGIEPGDVIVQFAGTTINRSGELPPLVSDVTPGSKAAVTVLRRGKTQELTVTVGEMKSIQAKGRPSTNEPAKLGLAVRPLTDKERKEVGVVGGLMVEEVHAGPAQEAGIQPGDVILSANGELLASVEQLQSKVDKSGKNLAVLVLRDYSRLFIPIHLG
jgi:serine protease Do